MPRYCIRLKKPKGAPKALDRFTWTEEEAESIFGVSQKFNPYHVPAGSPEGGQFTSPDKPYAIVLLDAKGNKTAPLTKLDSLYDHLVQRPDGSWGLSPERQAIHQKIIDDILAGAKKSDDPTLFMTGGGPAVGKTAAVGKLIPEDGVVSVDPDWIKTQLPGWDDKVKAGDKSAGSFYHEESSLIRKMAEKAAIAGSFNIKLDTTGDSSITNLTKSIAAYKAAGYKIHGYYASCDVQEAIRRAAVRASETGRSVPEAFMRETHANVSYTAPKAFEKGIFDSFKVFDTNGETPKLIAQGGGTNLEIIDKSAYQKFLDKANVPELTAAKSDEIDRVQTDDLEKMVKAILRGQKPKKLKGRAAKIWNELTQQIAATPKGQFVWTGNELSDVDLTSIYTDTAKKYAITAGAMNTTQWVPIRKTDEEKQIVYGEVYAPYVLDTYGEFMTPEDIELMAHRFMKLDLSKVIDTQHDNQPNGSYPVESFVAREGDPDYTPGAWVLGVHIPDPELWQSVKTGMLNGFSFQSLVKPTSVDVEIDVIRDFVGETELSEDHHHTFFVELDEIGNVVGGRTSKAADGHYHEIKWASVTGRSNGHSHRFFL